MDFWSFLFGAYVADTMSKNTKKEAQAEHVQMAGRGQGNSTLLRSPCGHNNKSTNKFCIHCGFKIH